MHAQHRMKVSGDPAGLLSCLSLKQELLLLLKVRLTGCTMAMLAEQHAELQLALLCWPFFEGFAHTPSRLSGTCFVRGAWTVSGLILPAMSLLQPSACSSWHSSSANTYSPKMLKQKTTHLSLYYIKWQCESRLTLLGHQGQYATQAGLPPRGHLGAQSDVAAIGNVFGAITWSFSFIQQTKLQFNSGRLSSLAAERA
jgi:hypothetical protein